MCPASPIRVVPVRIRHEGLRQLHVDRRPREPIHGAERALQSHVAPVAVARHTLHVHVDASGSQRFLEEDAGVGAAREGTLGDLQLEARAAGLLPQELRLIRIVHVRRVVLDEVLVEPGDEPRRVCRRLQALRGWSDEQANDELVFSRGAGSRPAEVFDHRAEHPSQWAAVSRSTSLTNRPDSLAATSETVRMQKKPREGLATFAVQRSFATVTFGRMPFVGVSSLDLGRLSGAVFSCPEKR